MPGMSRLVDPRRRHHQFPGPPAQLDGYIIIELRLVADRVLLQQDTQGRMLGWLRHCTSTPSQTIIATMFIDFSQQRDTSQPSKSFKHVIGDQLARHI